MHFENIKINIYHSFVKFEFNSSFIRLFSLSKKSYFAGFEVLTTLDMKRPIFWVPWKPTDVSEEYIALYLFNAGFLHRHCIQSFDCPFRLVSCLVYSSTLRMEATCSSEMSIDFKRTTRPYIPEDRSLHILFHLTSIIHGKLHTISSLFNWHCWIPVV
jgi:hypothetical protein